MPIYNIKENNLSLIKKIDFKNEKELQKLTENNLGELFNLEFIDTEFQVNNLRIDTLAYDNETNSFVIIEYKNTRNYSVIDQGYSYLSLLLNNKAEFVLKYNQVLGKNKGKEDFDFTQTRVMFISPSYTTYQLKSVEFSDIAFELWKVSKYSNDTVLFDKVNNDDASASIKQVTKKDSTKEKVNKEIKKYTEQDTLKGKNEDVISLYESLKEFILSNYEDIEIFHLKFYFAFKINNKNIVTVSVLSNSLKTWINLKESKISDPDNRIRDVSNIGHHGVGDYEFKIESEDDFYYFNRLFKQAYDEKL